jgi:molybdate transport system regulatory protein
MKACLRIRVDFEEGTILSPGKVRLFELVDQHGSIEEAASIIHMHPALARRVIRRLEGLFGGALVERASNGADVQRWRLTALGRKVIERYRETERASALAADQLLRELTSLAPDRQRSDASATQDFK